MMTHKISLTILAIVMLLLGLGILYLLIRMNSKINKSIVILKKASKDTLKHITMIILSVGTLMI